MRKLIVLNPQSDFTLRGRQTKIEPYWNYSQKVMAYSMYVEPTTAPDQRFAKFVADYSSWFDSTKLAVAEKKLGKDMLSPYSERKGTKQKRKEWLRLKKEGFIVTNSYQHYKIDMGQRIVETIFSSMSHFGSAYPFQTPTKDFGDMARFPFNSWEAWDRGVIEPGVGIHKITTVNLLGEVSQRRTFDDAAKKIALEKLKFNWDVDVDLSTRTLADLNGKTLDLLTTMAEARSTIDMIYGTLRRILIILVRFRKESIRKTSLKFFNFDDIRLKDPQLYAELWLEYRYGLMPLLYTVEDALKVLEGYPSAYVDEKKKKVIRRPSPLNQNYEEEIVHRCFIRRRLDISSNVKVFKNKTSFDPFVTAWELIPLSMIVDYVLNIGACVAAIWEPDNLQTASTYSVKTVCHGESNRDFLDYELYERVVFTPQAHVGLAFSDHMNAKRYTDLAALAKVILAPTRYNQRLL